MKTTDTETILIVDDSRAEALITQKILSLIAPEITTETVLSGEAAIELLQKSGTLPALIFLDLKMLGLSGFDVLRLIRSDERQKHIPIIVVSNSTLEKDKEESLKAGANDFLHKDFDIDCFGKNMEVLLKRYLGIF